MTLSDPLTVMLLVIVAALIWALVAIVTAVDRRERQVDRSASLRARVGEYTRSSR